MVNSQNILGKDLWKIFRKALTLTSEKQSEIL